MKLTRELRCASTERTGEASDRNSWAGSDGADRFEQFWTLRLTVEGDADPATGYLCDVHELDELMRDHVVPSLRAQAQDPHHRSAVAPALRSGFDAAMRHCRERLRLYAVTLSVSPYTAFTVFQEDAVMVRLTRSFEFSAAHRLCCSGLSDDENRRLFGKCSNPHGHGHNYVLDVTIRGEIDAATGTIVDLPALDRIVEERVIEPLDHKHLNVECDDFATLNPSVENIASVVFRRLDGAFDRAELVNVRVWETPKTYADVGRRDQPH